METLEPCYTCRFHQGGWQNCSCLICKPEFHKDRCINNIKMHCCFYKKAEDYQKEKVGTDPLPLGQELEGPQKLQLKKDKLFLLQGVIPCHNFVC
jgi:hypothetical protein